MTIVSSDSLLVPRIARKAWRCVCADELRGYDVRVSYTANGWTGGRSRTLAEAEAFAARKLGTVANRNGDRYTDYEIDPIPNPDYRPGCRRDIPVGDRYVEYVGDTAPYRSGSRYCLDCALDVWADYLTLLPKG